MAEPKRHMDVPQERVLKRVIRRATTPRQNTNKGGKTMSGKTINSAILLLIIGNAMALLSDVFIKLLEPGAPVFQFAFLRSVLTLASPPRSVSTRPSILYRSVMERMAKRSWA